MRVRGYAGRHRCLTSSNEESKRGRQPAGRPTRKPRLARSTGALLGQRGPGGGGEERCEDLAAPPDGRDKVRVGEVGDPQVAVLLEFR